MLPLGDVWRHVLRKSHEWVRNRVEYYAYGTKPTFTKYDDINNRVKAERLIRFYVQYNIQGMVMGGITQSHKSVAAREYIYYICKWKKLQLLKRLGIVYVDGEWYGRSVPNPYTGERDDYINNTIGYTFPDIHVYGTFPRAVSLAYIGDNHCLSYRYDEFHLIEFLHTISASTHSENSEIINKLIHMNKNCVSDKFMYNMFVPDPHIRLPDEPEYTKKKAISIIRNIRDCFTYGQPLVAHWIYRTFPKTLQYIFENNIGEIRCGSEVHTLADLFLCYACIGGDVASIKYCLRLGAKNYLDGVATAERYGHCEVSQWLLKIYRKLEQPPTLDN